MIYDRSEVRDGARLVGRYRGVTYTVAVTQTGLYRIRHRFEIVDQSDGSATRSLVGVLEFSISGIARRICGGSVNGWRFFSIEGQAPRPNTSYTSSRNQGRRFGIEIEFSCQLTAQDLVNKLREAGISAYAEGYSHRTPTYWKMTTDGSVHPYGHELISPILQGEGGFEQIRTVCRVLQENGASVNRTCGLHVHHDGRTLTLDEIKQVARWFYNNQSVLDSFVSRSREMNGYCQHIQSTTLRAIELATHSSQFGNIGRYYNLNVCCYPRDGSIEFRQHQGSINATKIIEWIRLGQAIIEDARTGAFSRYTSVDSLLQGLAGLTDATRAFFTARAANFAALARAA